MGTILLDPLHLLGSRRWHDVGCWLNGLDARRYADSSGGATLPTDGKCFDGAFTRA